MVQTTERLISTDAQRYLLIYMIAVLVILTGLVILFFIVFQKRKNKLLLDKIKKQQEFEEEIVQAQTEIQEQTLKNIGWELHDNVGQLLSFASMQLNLLTTQVEDKFKQRLDDTKDAVKESIKEIRTLSKTLNNEVILNIGFEKSITNELDRLERMKFTSAKLYVKGDKVELKNKKHEIIIFRILQEFFSNSVKYSEAKNLKITLNYLPEMLQIVATDDGKGFNMDTVEKGSGLINMESRAALINAQFKLETKPKNGVILKIDYSLSCI
jgi:hypothetical protein